MVARQQVWCRWKRMCQMNAIFRHGVYESGEIANQIVFCNMIEEQKYWASTFIWHVWGSVDDNFPSRVPHVFSVCQSCRKRAEVAAHSLYILKYIGRNKFVRVQGRLALRQPYQDTGLNSVEEVTKAERNRPARGPWVRTMENTPTHQ
jgi:hypothetical protein